MVPTQSDNSQNAGRLGERNATNFAHHVCRTFQIIICTLFLLGYFTRESGIFDASVTNDIFHHVGCCFHEIKKELLVFLLLIFDLSTMTDMYEDPVTFEGKLKPYPHAERPEVSGIWDERLDSDGMALDTSKRTHPTLFFFWYPNNSAAVPMIPWLICEAMNSALGNVRWRTKR